MDQRAHQENYSNHRSSYFTVSHHRTPQGIYYQYIFTLVLFWEGAGLQEDIAVFTKHTFYIIQISENNLISHIRFR